MRLLHQESLRHRSYSPPYDKFIMLENVANGIVDSSGSDKVFADGIKRARKRPLEAIQVNGTRNNSSILHVNPTSSVAIHNIPSRKKGQKQMKNTDRSSVETVARKKPDDKFADLPSVSRKADDVPLNTIAEDSETKKLRSRRGVTSSNGVSVETETTNGKPDVPLSSIPVVHHRKRAKATFGRRSRKSIALQKATHRQKLKNGKNTSRPSPKKVSFANQNDDGEMISAPPRVLPRRFSGRISATNSGRDVTSMDNKVPPAKAERSITDVKPMDNKNVAQKRRSSRSSNTLNSTINSDNALGNSELLENDTVSVESTNDILPKRCSRRLFNTPTVRFNVKLINVDDVPSTSREKAGDSKLPKHADMVSKRYSKQTGVPTVSRNVTIVEDDAVPSTSKTTKNKFDCVDLKSTETPEVLPMRSLRCRSSIPTVKRRVTFAEDTVDGPKNTVHDVPDFDGSIENGAFSSKTVKKSDVSTRNVKRRDGNSSVGLHNSPSSTNDISPTTIVVTPSKPLVVTHERVQGAPHQSPKQMDPESQEEAVFAGDFCALRPKNVPMKNKYLLPRAEPKKREAETIVMDKRKKFLILSPHKELFDTAPIRSLKQKLKFPKPRKNFIVDNKSKWCSRWNYGVQVRKNSRTRHRRIFDSVFESTYQYENRSFSLVDKLIKKKDVEVKARSYSYKIDVEDDLWIQRQNLARAKNEMALIDYSTFLKIMDVFESDVYLSMCKILLEQLASSRRFFDRPDAVACDICYLPDCEDDDNIIFCDGCETVVHQTCYGLDDVPDHSWLCDMCLMEKDNLKCMLCPLPNGTMKRSNSGDGLVHVACALWIPEVKFEDPIHRDGISINTKKRHVREAPFCEVCNISCGSYVECSVPSCIKCYHVSCGQRAGNTFDVKQAKIGVDDTVQFITYCQEHSRDDLPLMRIENDFITKQPRTTKEDIEKRFMTYTDSTSNPAFDEKDLQFSVCIFEYWKIKRLERGSQLVAPFEFDVASIPIFTEKPSLKNHIRRIKEPRETRMSSDNARTLMWMTQDRESKKRAAMDCVSNLIETTVKQMNRDKGSWTDDHIDSFFNQVASYCAPETKKSKPAPIQVGYRPSAFRLPAVVFDSENYITDTGGEPQIYFNKLRGNSESSHEYDTSQDESMEVDEPSSDGE